jgi:hypothetical protein
LEIRICIQSFGEETEREKDHFEGLGVSETPKVMFIIQNNWEKNGVNDFDPECVQVSSSSVRILILYNSGGFMEQLASRE